VKAQPESRELVPLVKYETLKKNVHLKPGETLSFKPGHGYFAKPAPWTQPPIVVKPPTVDLSSARNVAFFATVTDSAITYFCRLPKTWKAAFTADHAYPVTDQQIAAVQASGHRAFVWCDCMTTLPDTALAMVEQRRDKDDHPLLDGWYGQAESASQFDVAIGALRAPVAIIGNLSSVRSDQLARVAAGERLFVNELYRNVQPWLQPDWRGANAGVGGNCAAVYASQSEGAVYTPISAYRALGLWNPACDSVYTEGMLEADWKQLA